MYQMNFSYSKQTLLRPQKEKYLSTFFIALFVAAALFVPYMIMGEGYFTFYGDFNVQQIPFYMQCHKAVKSGNIFWSWTTDLGANFIGSYSFYLLGSPFFWLTIPFPNWMVPYLMGPLLILKFACAAFTSYFYIRRFTRTPQAARLGALLYAFSGFSIYNIFFNHFHEAIIAFPILLLALEQLITETRRIVFALSVALCAVTNYFFFFGMVVFTVIYFFVRLFSGDIKVKFSRFIVLIFEAVLGVCLSAFLLLPSILAIIDNTRVSSILLGWSAIMYGKEQIYGNIIECFFFPPDIPARPVFFPGANVKWSSLGGWLPLFSMTGVFVWFSQRKNHWLKRVIGICIFMAMVPFLNSAFYAFNTSYYARWFYMPILVACFMTAYALENSEIDMKYGLKWCGFAVVLISMVGILPSEVSKDIVDIGTGDTTTTKVTELFQLPNEKLPFWISVVLAITAIIVCYILVRNKAKIRTNKFLQKSYCFTMVACLCFSYYTLIYGRAIGPKVGDYNNIVNATIELDDDSFYRVETYGVTNNANMLWGMYGFRSFHSILPGSAFEYYSGMGFNRSVNTDPDGSYYAMRSVNSTKYLVIQSYKLEYSDTKTLLENLKNFEKIDEQDGFTIFKNKAYIPIGYSNSYYISDDEYEKIAKSNRDNMLARAVVLTDEQIEKYSDILPELEPDRYSDFNYYTFEKDAQELAKTAVDTFTPTANGFKATSSFTEDRFVTFTVPWESGWSATINGEKAEIEKVNRGVMGIKVPAGECNIEFNYVTPGLKAGVVCTIGAAFIIVIYYIVLKKVFRYKPNPNVHLYEQQQLDTVINHNAYIRTIEKTVDEQLESSELSKGDNGSDESNENADISGAATAVPWQRQNKEMKKKEAAQKRGQYAFI